MVAELQRHLMQLFKENAARSAEASRELQELDERRQLLAGVHAGAEVAQMFSTVPCTAELLEERIALGLQGDQQACEEARDSARPNSGTD